MFAWDHAAESAWHASLQRKYEGAATDPWKPVDPDPLKPKFEEFLPLRWTIPGNFQ
jgi:hypothetical protein